ncbi:MAG: AAA family ATPase [bacterium]|nr:AAA family ATPase [bacterium]
MTKTFNITGSCIPAKHYTADMSKKTDRIKKMIANGDYFAINRPRQYGKTTIMYLLEQQLAKEDDYLTLTVSFEEIDAPTYEKQDAFIAVFLDILKEQLEFLKEKELITLIPEKSPVNFKPLSTLITRLVDRSGRKVVLMVDEVDKACNNQLFLDFLGMLRSKYLKKSQGKDQSFHAVILAGVHDIKTVKPKIRADEAKTFNSPWNIAVDFDVDLELSPDEIASMLEEYAKEQQVRIDIPFFKEALFYYTSGYPFLVSSLCKTIAEKILPRENKKTSTSKEWKKEYLIEALQVVLMADNTNFDSLIKNLENNPDLYDFVFKIIMDGHEYSFNSDNPLIRTGRIYGIIRKEDYKAKIHNRMYEQRIYNYMASKVETSEEAALKTVSSSYITKTGKLDIEKLIRKFQEFMKEQYSQKDTGFIERNGRLLFLAFIRPIINGKGFDFKEVQVSEEKRLDIVITFGSERYIIELKIWRGEAYHREGIRQLRDYLDRQNEDTGYLLIYDLKKQNSRIGKYEQIKSDGKTIHAAWL